MLNNIVFNLKYCVNCDLVNEIIELLHDRSNIELLDTNQKTILRIKILK